MARFLARMIIFMATLVGCTNVTPTATSMVAQATPNLPIRATATLEAQAPIPIATQALNPTAKPDQPTATSYLDVPAGDFVARFGTGRLLYVCEQGVCDIGFDGKDQRVLAPIPPGQQMRGIAYDAMGQTFLYAVTTEPGKADVNWLKADGSAKLNDWRDTIQGTENGLGEHDGYSVLGISDAYFLYESSGQVIGSPVGGGATSFFTPKFVYGASSSHRWYLDLTRTNIMRVTTGQPNRAEIYTTAGDENQQPRIVDLPLDLHPVGFGKDANQLVALRYDPPFDPNSAINPATIDRTVMEVVIYNTETKATTPLVTSAMINYYVGGLDMIQDYNRSLAVGEDRIGGTYLYNVETQQAAVVGMPNRIPNTQIEIYIIEPYSK